jgi:N-glycosylase/DNA lyase
MRSLINRIENLKQNKVKKLVNTRIKEFKNINSRNKIFNELCFCILTANFNAERSIKIQNEIKNGFSTLSYSQLKKKLNELGHRYPNARAKYIFEARKRKDLFKNIKSFKENELREWLVNNVKGLGYKESSHFLRNIGYENFAIIDFHIVDLLTKHKLIERPKNLSKKKYLEIENLMKNIADRLNITLAELDMYLWYLETGKILK